MTLRTDKGVTIVELIIVTMMTGLLVGYIFSTWLSFNRHVASQTRKSMLQSELRQISQSIGSHLRRSPLVLDWHEKDITYIESTTKDTVQLVFTEDQLLRNDTAVAIATPTGRFRTFVIEEDENSRLFQGKGVALLCVTIGLENTFHDTCSMRMCTAVHLLQASDTERGAGEWNF